MRAASGAAFCAVRWCAGQGRRASGCRHARLPAASMSHSQTRTHPNNRACPLTPHPPPPTPAEMLVMLRNLYQRCRLVHADLSEYNVLVSAAAGRLFREEAETAARTVPSLTAPLCIPHPAAAPPRSTTTSCTASTSARRWSWTTRAPSTSCERVRLGCAALGCAALGLAAGGWGAGRQPTAWAAAASAARAAPCAAPLVAATLPRCPSLTALRAPAAPASAPCRLPARQRLLPPRRGGHADGAGQRAPGRWRRPERKGGHACSGPFLLSSHLAPCVPQARELF